MARSAILTRGRATTQLVRGQRESSGKPLRVGLVEALCFSPRKSPAEAGLRW